jgi:hypothetical protein
MYPLLIGIILLIVALIWMRRPKPDIQDHKALEKTEEVPDVCPALMRTDCLTAPQCGWCVSSGMCIRMTNAAVCEGGIEGVATIQESYQDATDLGPGRKPAPLASDMVFVSSGINSIMGAMKSGTEALLGIKRN